MADNDKPSVWAGVQSSLSTLSLLLVTMGIGGVVGNWLGGCFTFMRSFGMAAGIIAGFIIATAVIIRRYTGRSGGGDA